MLHSFLLVQQQEWHTENSSVLQFSVQSYTSSFPSWKHTAWLAWVLLLLFELTQDYGIVLPLLGAVGLSSWITSGQTRIKVIGKTKKLKQGNTSSIQQPEVLSPTANGISSSGASAERTSNASDLCEIESSLCIDGSDTDTEHSASLPVDARLLKRAHSWFCLNNYKSKYN